APARGRAARELALEDGPGLVGALRVTVELPVGVLALDHAAVGELHPALAQEPPLLHAALVDAPVGVDDGPAARRPHRRERPRRRSARREGGPRGVQPPPPGPARRRAPAPRSREPRAGPGPPPRRSPPPRPPPRP